MSIRGPAPRRALLAVPVVLVLVAVLAPARAGAMTVYAASSLQPAFTRISSHVTYSFAGSNQLQLQIERGAPADLFASASPKEARALNRAGRCETPFTFATNVLVLAVPRGNPSKVTSVYSLRQGRRRLAIGNAAVPIGDYTRRLLAKLGLTSILSTNTVSLEPNVAGIVAKVALRSADAGFVYATDVRAAGGRIKRVPLPARAQPPVRYQACIVRRPGVDRRGALQYLRRLLSPQGRSVLRRAGFGLPRR